jgi:hypothetical protein
LTGRGFCEECGSLGEVNKQYSDPIESNWQLARALRRFKLGRAIAAVMLASLLFGLAVSVYNALK